MWPRRRNPIENDPPSLLPSIECVIGQSFSTYTLPRVQWRRPQQTSGPRQDAFYSTLQREQYHTFCTALFYLYHKNQRIAIYVVFEILAPSFSHMITLDGVEIDRA
jgi:hypothetical protein